MKHAPNTINYLRKFCDGTGLGPFELDELKAANYIAQTPQDKSWFVTVAGHAALQAQQELPLGDIEHSQHYYDFNRNRPFGEDMTHGPDDDSYLPPPRTTLGQRIQEQQRSAGMQMLLNAGRTFGDALDKQEGGAHYKDCTIQPIEYIHANKLGYIEGNVVKYITRHTTKGGAEDVRKVIHYCELLLQLQYGEKA